MTNTATAMVPYEEIDHVPARLSLVTPLVDPSAALAAMQQYEALKKAIVQPEDIFRKRNKKGELVEYLKKRFWRRLAALFGLSLSIVSEEHGFDERGALFYRVIAQAAAPNGRTMDGDGYCSAGELGHEYWPEHSIRATAVTRAKNRAISDLVGGGEVSAEELDDEREDHQAKRQQGPITREDRAEMVRLCQALGKQYDEKLVTGHEHAMVIIEALSSELGKIAAKELELEAGLREEDEQLAKMAGVDNDTSEDTSAESDEDVITYSLDEADEEAEAPAPAPVVERVWRPLEDAKFIRSLRDINVVSVADQEQFIADAQDSYPSATLRDACKQEYARRYNALQKAQRAEQEKQEKQTKPASAKATGKRGPSALGAVAAPGQTIPESLEGLETLKRGS